MPFTLSHAGFVLPLKRKVSPIILCGLMIGSIVPDFAYFVREFAVASFAHTIAGALCISLPVGLMVHFVLRLCFQKIAEALPQPHSSFLISWNIDRPLPRNGLLGVVTAIFLGALFHNFVDSFTHESGAAISIFPALGREAISIGGEPLHVFRILQYAGSILGMVMLVIAYFCGLARYCKVGEIQVWQDKKSWLALFVLTLLTMLLAAVLNAKFLPGSIDVFAFRVFGFKFLITWLPIIGVAFLCFALFRSRFSRSAATRL
jgi:Domain of unknown function (DUF4184)